MNKWENCKARISQGKGYLSACVYNTFQIYIFGGYNSKYLKLDEIELLDIRNEGKTGWEKIEIVSPKNSWGPVYWCGVINYFDESIYIFGGISENVNPDIYFKFDPQKREMAKMEKQGTKANGLFYCSTPPQIYGKSVFGICSKNAIHVFGEDKSWNIIQASDVIKKK